MPEDFASGSQLRAVLEDRPVLWVGAGLSMAAGLPSTNQLVAAMVAQAAVKGSIDLNWPFERVADAYVESMGKTALSRLLQRQLGKPGQLTEAHRAIARAAGAGRFAAILTTNYDPLLEVALAAAKVNSLVQVLESNAMLPDEDAVRLLKLHGSYEDWERTVLSGHSYKRYQFANSFLQQQVNVYLRQNPVLFVGCSLQDPRILKWLGALDAGARDQLHPWRALIRKKAWGEAMEKGGDVLRMKCLEPLLLRDHNHLQQLWEEAVPLGDTQPIAPHQKIKLSTWADLRACLAEAYFSKSPRIDPETTPQSWWESYQSERGMKG